jgi:hypothetical protein
MLQLDMSLQGRFFYKNKDRKEKKKKKKKKKEMKIDR